MTPQPTHLHPTPQPSHRSDRARARTPNPRHRHIHPVSTAPATTRALPKPAANRSLLTRKADEAMDHVGVRLTEQQTAMQVGMTEWVAGELDRTTEWVGRLREEQQAAMQAEAAEWLGREMERAPRVAMASARDAYLGWLWGEEGVATAVLAWLPVVFVAGETVKVGVEVGKLVYSGLVGETGGKRRVGF
ncbi:hypothetical protein B0T25DRAFT_359515 [Lasiosphaeria hispida]|uniref:Uncharacterized protein n=1 Tax=Lasiosphaeria hispida TaxID=260671 RepID=A0AAJ0M8X9_9PEZI|nr:hypothetical protein B0T25DRAFT_359515 [Lasiosphaeria hispida]